MLNILTAHRKSKAIHPAHLFNSPTFFDTPYTVTMAGELISSHTFHASNDDMWEQGYGNFSSKSMNELFDVDGDGGVSGIEKDRMESAGLYNTLDSIHPLVARSFNDTSFRINTGRYLTELNNTADNKAINVIMQFLDEYNEDTKPPVNEEIKENDQQPLEVSYKNLSEDLVERRRLDQSELTNDV